MKRVKSHTIIFCQLISKNTLQAEVLWTLLDIASGETIVNFILQFILLFSHANSFIRETEA